MFNRRHFIKLLSLAATALIAKPSGMAIAEVSTFDSIETIFKDMMPAVVDYVFTPSPLMKYIREKD